MTFKVGILLFADDIVLIAPSEENLQLMINFANTWCLTNRMSVNIGKTKIVHLRKKSLPRTDFEFYFGNTKIEICENYKYLGVVLNEYVDFTETSNVLSEAAGKAFSSLVSNLYKKIDIMYSYL